MPVTKLRRFQPKNAPKAFGGRASPGPNGEAYSAPEDVTGFKSRGSDKGRRNGEKTGGDRQLREGGRGMRERARGKKGRKRVRRMEMEGISQGRPKALPATQNASQKFSGSGGGQK